MNIIILGASGQVGSVVHAGLSEHHSVVATSRKASKGFVQFDPFLDDWSALGEAGVLINCIGQIDPTRSMSFYRIHVGLTELILKNRRLIGNPRLLQISALGASANHAVEFLRSKGIADDLLLRETNTAVIRPSILCTHRTMIVRKMLMLSKMARLAFGYVFVPKGFLETKIQPVMPDDFAAVVEEMCRHTNDRIINAVGADRLSFREIIALLSTCTNRKILPVEVPKKMMDLVIGGFVSKLFPAIINTQQYYLLFQENVADARACELLIGHRMHPTRAFFSEEFS